MARRRRKTALALPAMMAQLGIASCEVIARRTAMMASGTCSPAEYRRMVREKISAAASTAALLVRTGGSASPGAMLAPLHRKATANAKRRRRS